VKLQTTRWVEIGKAIGQALTRTPEDSAVEIPPLIRASIEFPGLLKSFAGGAGPWRDSCFLGANFSQGSGNPGGTTQTAQLTAGVWHLKGFLVWTLSAAAAGFTKGVTLQCTDPTGLAQTLLTVGSLIVPAPAITIVPIDYTFAFGDDGFRLQIVNGAIAAGDAAETRLSVYAGKLL
jgi:hypothetical protein